MGVWSGLGSHFIFLWISFAIVTADYNDLEQFHRILDYVPILPETNVTVITASKADICASKCLSLHQCLSFVYIPTYGKCWLSWESLPLDSGIVEHRGAQFYQKMQGTHEKPDEFFYFMGVGEISDNRLVPLLTQRVTTHSDCTILCIRSDLKCLAVTYHSLIGVCILYTPTHEEDANTLFHLVSSNTNPFIYTVARYGKFSFKYSALYGAMSPPSQEEVIATKAQSSTEMCAHECLLSQSPICRSFQYDVTSRECQLLKSALLEEAPLIRSSNTVYFSPKVAPPCSGEFSNQIILAEEGFITSPGWPHAYEAPSSCKWQISPPQGKSVSIVVQTPHLHTNQNGTCMDKLTIDSDVLLCTRSQEQVVRTFNHPVTIVFHATSTNPNKLDGFKVSYSTTWSCTGELTSPVGSIASPNYPDPYGITRCKWVITAPKDTKILLEFVSFQVDKVKVETGKCLLGSDMLSVKWGGLLGERRYCGHVIPTVEAVSNKVTLEFQSFTNRVYGGFLLNYHFSDIQSPTECNTKIALNRSFVETTVNLTGLQSPLSINCLVEIETDTANDQILVDFQNFAVGRRRPFYECIGGYVKAWDGPNTKSSYLGNFCGKKPPSPLRSTGPTLTLLLHFTQGNSLPLDEKEGFIAKVSLVPQEPANELREAVTYRAVNNSLCTPDYPNSTYPHNTHGIWRLQANDTNHHILLKFEEFQLASFTTSYPITDPIDYVVNDNDDRGLLVCDWDYVIVSSKVSSTASTSSIKAQLCGAGSMTFPASNQRRLLSLEEDIFISDDSEMMVELFTNDRWNGPGFSATYQEIFSYYGSSNLNDPTAVVQSCYLHTPQYPEMYANENSHLYWSVPSLHHPAAIFLIKRLQWKAKEDTYHGDIRSGVVCDPAKALMFKTSTSGEVIRCDDIGQKEWDMDNEEMIKLHFLLPVNITLSGEVKLLMEVVLTNELPLTSTLPTTVISTVSETTAQTESSTTESTSTAATTTASTTTETSTPTTTSTTTATPSTTPSSTTESTLQPSTPADENQLTPSPLFRTNTIYGSAGAAVIILVLLCVLITAIVLGRKRRRLQRLHDVSEPDWMDNSLYRSPEDVVSVLFDNTKKSVQINNSRYMRF